ncbi:hypothetical protein C0214_19750 [Methylobacterium sp. DM1]|nr:hypothetical protein C0214_19750 [Methylobacterium sp. DM1]
MKEQPMRTEPSDILKLLKLLGDEQGDHTCRQMHDLAVRDGLHILDVCHEAIRILASEKKTAQDRFLRLAAMMPANPVTITTEEAEKHGLKRWKPDD